MRALIEKMNLIIRFPVDQMNSDLTIMTTSVTAFLQQAQRTKPRVSPESHEKYRNSTADRADIAIISEPQPLIFAAVAASILAPSLSLLTLSMMSADEVARHAAESTSSHRAQHSLAMLLTSLLALWLIVMLLQLVLCHAANDGTTDGTEEAVVGLMASETASETTGQGSSEATITFLGTAWATLRVVGTLRYVSVCVD